MLRLSDHQLVRQLKQTEKENNYSGLLRCSNLTGECKDKTHQREGARHHSCRVDRRLRGKLRPRAGGIVRKRRWEESKPVIYGRLRGRLAESPVLWNKWLATDTCALSRRAREVHGVWVSLEALFHGLEGRSSLQNQSHNLKKSTNQWSLAVYLRVLEQLFEVNWSHDHIGQVRWCLHERKQDFHDIFQTYLHMVMSEKPPHESITAVFPSWTVSITSLLPWFMGFVQF